jgi:hypothetical protein
MASPRLAASLRVGDRYPKGRRQRPGGARSAAAAGTASTAATRTASCHQLQRHN